MMEQNKDTAPASPAELTEHEAAEPAPVARQGVALSDEHYEEVKATLKGAHAIMESLSAIERRVGPVGSHARGYTHKITNALRHLEKLNEAARASSSRAEKSADRAMLEAVSQDLETSTWECARCGHSEDCKTLDAAYMLRDYLATKPTTSAQPAADARDPQTAPASQNANSRLAEPARGESREAFNEWFNAKLASGMTAEEIAFGMHVNNVGVVRERDAARVDRQGVALSDEIARFERIKRLALDAGGVGALPVPKSLRKIVRECLDGAKALSRASSSRAEVERIVSLALDHCYGRAHVSDDMIQRTTDAVLAAAEAPNGEES